MVKRPLPLPILCKWFDHDPKKWEEFEKKYHEELDQNDEVVPFFQTAAKAGTVTLIYAAKDEEHNNAVALKSYLDKKLKKK